MEGKGRRRENNKLQSGGLRVRRTTKSATKTVTGQRGMVKSTKNRRQGQKREKVVIVMILVIQCLFRYTLVRLSNDAEVSNDKEGKLKSESGERKQARIRVRAHS